MSDFDDQIRELLPPVTPLNAPPATFARVTRAARKRKRNRLVSFLASAAVAVTALGFASRAAWPVAVQPTTSHIPQCTAANLQMSVRDDAIAGAAAIGREVLMTNQGSHRCEVSGYPTVSMVSSADGGILAVARKGSTTLWKDPGSHPLHLDSGAAAVFGVEWRPSTTKCSDSRTAIGALKVTMPGQPPSPNLALADAGCLQGGLAVTALAAYDVGLTPSG